MIKYTKEQFIKKSIINNGDIYDFTNSDYVGSQKEITVKCKNCNNVFSKTACRFLDKNNAGKLCKICQTNFSKTNTENFIQKFKYKFPDSCLNFDKFAYKNSRAASIVICPVHGDFERTPDSLLNGGGCNKCSYGNVLKNKNAIGWLNKEKIEKNKESLKSAKCFVYLINLENDKENFIKIGITSDSKKRYHRLPYKITEVCNIRTNFYDAYYAEHYLHQVLKEFSYIPLKNFGGKTECFKIKNTQYLVEIIKYQLNFK